MFITMFLEKAEKVASVTPWPWETGHFVGKYGKNIGGEAVVTSSKEFSICYRRSPGGECQGMHLL